MHKLRSRGTVLNPLKGFTLIELLVVIAIIGILSAVVLASLNTARSKGSDAAVQSDLDGIRTQAEIYYGGTGSNSYGTAGSSCAGAVFSDSVIQNALKGASQANGSGAASGAISGITCNNSTTAYAAESRLNSSATTYWCVDSTGVSRQVTTALGSATACPAS